MLLIREDTQQVIAEIMSNKGLASFTKQYVISSEGGKACV